MRIDAQTPMYSSFLNSEKDLQLILKKLFVTSGNYSDTLKRLLAINTPDCLDNTTEPKYLEKINSLNLKELKKQGYIRTTPKINIQEHEEVKNYIIISLDNFEETSNPAFRDCTLSFDIICNQDYWDLGDFRIRPLKIAGYIDGLLNNSKLSGIGKIEFIGCKELILDETLGGYVLMYRILHGAEDRKQEGYEQKW